MSQKDLFSQSLFCEIPWTPQGCERLKSTLRASPEPMLCSSLPWSFGLDSSHFKLGHPTAGQKKKDPLITTLTVKLLFFSVFRASCRHPNPSLTRTVTLRALAMPSSTWLSGLTLWTENGGKVHTEIRQSGCVKNWDVSWVLSRLLSPDEFFLLIPSFSTTRYQGNETRMALYMACP